MRRSGLDRSRVEGAIFVVLAVSRGEYAMSRIVCTIRRSYEDEPKTRTFTPPK